MVVTERFFDRTIQEGTRPQETPISQTGQVEVPAVFREAITVYESPTERMSQREKHRQQSEQNRQRTLAEVRMQLGAMIQHPEEKRPDIQTRLQWAERNLVYDKRPPRR